MRKGHLMKKTFRKIIVVTMALAIAVSILVIPANAAGGSIAWGAATVDASSLNIRKGPGTDYDRVGIVAGGTILVILEKTNSDWYKVNYSGTVGYASTEYLTEVLKAENFKAIGTVNGDDVRMRKGHSTDTDVITTYDTGDKVNIIGINEGWYKVTGNDGTGYIRSDFVDVTGGVARTIDTKSTSSNVDTNANSESASLGQQIANYALQYVGYRYVYGEESPSKGFDCSGLMYYVYGHFGYKLQRTAHDMCMNNGKPVSKSELQPGDLIFFSSNGSHVGHVGMYIGGGQFVHASTSKTGVIISDLGSSYYTRVYYAARRIV